MFALRRLQYVCRQPWCNGDCTLVVGRLCKADSDQLYVSQCIQPSFWSAARGAPLTLCEDSEIFFTYWPGVHILVHPCSILYLLQAAVQGQQCGISSAGSAVQGQQHQDLHHGPCVKTVKTPLILAGCSYPGASMFGFCCRQQCRVSSINICKVSPWALCEVPGGAHILAACLYPGAYMFVFCCTAGRCAGSAASTAARFAPGAL